MNHARMRFVATLTAATVAALGTTAATPSRDAATVRQAATCADLLVLGAHGMNESAAPANNNMGAFLQHLYLRIQTKMLPGPEILAGDGVVYPTTTILDLKYLLNKRKNPDPKADKLAKRIDSQVRSAAKVLSGLVTTKLTACPDQDIVLAGYSQGAWVVDLFIQDYAKVAAKLEAVLLFGDPQYKPCLKPKSTDCITTLNVANATGVARDKYLRNLVGLGSDIPKYLPIPNPAYTDEGPTALWDRTRSYCLAWDANNFDPICAWSAEPVTSLRNILLHINGYYTKVDGNGKSMLDYAAEFIDETVVKP